MGWIDAFLTGAAEGLESPRIFPRFVEYAWRVAINILYVSVAIYILDRAAGRTEQIIVPALGLLYVSVRVEALIRMRETLVLTWGVGRETARIRELLGDKAIAERKEQLERAEREAPHKLFKSLIDGASLAVIGLICLWTLWSRL